MEPRYLDGTGIPVDLWFPLDMSGLTPEIPFMASLWIRSGYDMKVEVSAETYQVGAHFKALIKAILVAPLKSFERFFRISSSPAGLCKCLLFTADLRRQLAKDQCSFFSFLGFFLG